MAKEAATATPEEGKLALTDKQKKDGDKRYWALVEETQKEEREAFKIVLMSYWKRGQRVASLLEKPRNYGNHTAENFGKDVRPKKPYSDIEVRKWHRFFLLYDLPKVTKAIDQGVPWRGIQALLGVEDEKRRDELQKQLSEGQIKSSDDLREIVRKENVVSRTAATRAGKRTENRGGLAVSTVYRNMLGFLNELGHKLDDFTEACKRHDKAPVNAESSQAESRRKECAKALKGAVKKFDRAVKASSPPDKKK